MSSQLEIGGLLTVVAEHPAAVLLALIVLVWALRQKLLRWWQRNTPSVMPWNW